MQEYKNCYFYSNNPDKLNHLIVDPENNSEFIFKNNEYNKFDIKIKGNKNNIKYITITKYKNYYDDILKTEIKKYKFYSAEDCKEIQ